MVRAAAALAWLAGLGAGLPCIYAIWYLADRGDVWTFLGFPTYGGGPFEDIGIKTTVPLLVCSCSSARPSSLPGGCCGSAAARVPCWRWRCCRLSSHSGSGSRCPRDRWWGWPGRR
jgi:hypothetical protein